MTRRDRILIAMKGENWNLNTVIIKDIIAELNFLWFVHDATEALVDADEGDEWSIRWSQLMVALSAYEEEIGDE